MPKNSTVIHDHTSSSRDSWWYLVQDDNGELYVEHENDDDPEGKRTRWPINEFLKSGGSAVQKLQKRVERMFEDDDA